MFEVIELNGKPTIATKQPTNHVYIVDVSGSMYSVLPEMKTHLKNVISVLSKPGDTFSIIYFSGKGQCGVVCQNIMVNDASSMTMLHNAVDRWLTAIGLTGFVEPIQLAKTLTKSITNGNPFNFVMLTDGYDNQWKKEEILKEVADLPTYFQSRSFIEFGWYCDRKLIEKMAEASNAFHFFSSGYEEYKQTFEKAIADVNQAPTVEVKVNKEAKHVVYIDGDKIVIASPSNGTVWVPETVERVHSVVGRDVKSKTKGISEDRVYLMLYYAVKMNDPQMVWDCLEKTGDVALVKAYSNAFSKQELSNFTKLVEEAVLNPGSRYKDGKDFSFIPAKDAYTIIDLLNDLSGENAQLYPADFEYKRTGRKTKQVNEELKYTPLPMNYQSITGIVFHASRANVSIQTKEQGVVELPDNPFGIESVKTHKTKNYTIIKDGIVNVEVLPVLVSRDFVELLQGKGVELEVVSEANGLVFCRINLKNLPVINRNMIEKVDLEEFKATVVELNENAARQKVAKHLAPVERSSGLTQEYGEDAAKWLSELGIRDYGFSPKVEQEESTDFYVATEFVYAVKGLSSLPSIAAVEKKKASGKPYTLGESLIAKYLDAGVVDTKAVIETQRSLNRLMSTYVYAILVGRAWFSGYEDRSLQVPLTVNGKETTLSIDIKDVEVKI